MDPPDPPDPQLLSRIRELEEKNKQLNQQICALQTSQSQQGPPKTHYAMPRIVMRGSPHSAPSAPSVLSLPLRERVPGQKPMAAKGIERPRPQARSLNTLPQNQHGGAFAASWTASRHSSVQSNTTSGDSSDPSSVFKEIVHQHVRRHDASSHPSEDVERSKDNHEKDYEKSDEGPKREATASAYANYDHALSLYTETEHITRAIAHAENRQVRGEIGRGTFGVVHMLHVKTPVGKRRCAVKTIREKTHHANRELAHAHFLLTHPHPNIVPFYHYEQDAHNNSVCRLYMKYVPHTLKDLLHRLWDDHVQLKKSVHLVLMTQFARALQHIHAHHICHRDLKPDNLLVDPDRTRLYLCDFGCAKILRPHNTAKSETYMCSRFYRAPELIIDRNLYGTEVDVWSYGCVFVECCIGRVFFMAADNTNLLVEHIRLLGELTEDHVRGMPTTECGIVGTGKFPNMQKREPRWAKVHKRRTFGPAYERLCADILQFDVRGRPTAPDLLASDYLGATHATHQEEGNDPEPPSPPPPPVSAAKTV